MEKLYRKVVILVHHCVSRFLNVITFINKFVSRINIEDKVFTKINVLFVKIVI